MKEKKPAITEHFADLKDPRVEGKNRHLLIDIIVIAICSVISGASGWEHMQIFGKSKYEWFASFLELPNGIPGHDTFRVDIRMIKTFAFFSRALRGQAAKIFGFGEVPDSWMELQSTYGLLPPHPLSGVIALPLRLILIE